jgi:hypothetical protein
MWKWFKAAFYSGAYLLVCRSRYIRFVTIPAMLVCFLQPLGLAGAALMAVSSAATYIMWRYRSQEPPDQSDNGTEAQQKSRKSVFIWRCGYLSSAGFNSIVVQNCRTMKQSWPKEMLHSGQMTGVFTSVKIYVYIHFTTYYYMPSYRYINSCFLAVK